MTEKIMDDDNDRCHDNFNQNFGSFYEQKCQKSMKNLQILFI